MMANMCELKLCPKCKKVPRYSVLPFNRRDGMYVHKLICHGCRMGANGRTEEEGIDRWNQKVDGYV